MPEPPFAVYYFTVGNVDFPVANRAILVELAHFFTHCCGGGTRINALVVCHADCCFCWTGSVSGQQLCVASPKPTPSALSSLPLLAEPALSPMIMCIGHRPKRAAKPRQVAAAAAQSALFPRFAARILLPAPVYTLAAEPGYRIRFPRQDTPAPNRLAQVDWMLDASRQQSRQAGWKESNMQYRGTLTYHL